MATTTEESPFLNLPTEIRLMIYNYLLVPSTSTPSKKPSPSTRVLRMRMVDPAEASFHWLNFVFPILQRTKCLMRTGRFRGRTMQTTYTVTNNPGIHASILSACKKTHAEGVEVLYGSYMFDFSTHIEAIPPFFSDLTPAAQHHFKRVGIVKRALPYDRDFDCAEWRTATYYISVLPSLRVLDLGVIAGKPGADGWDEVQEWSRHDFECWTKRSWSGLEWVKDLARIKVKELNVKAIVEHCPPPMSEMMSFWVGVSKSVDEGGFGEWVGALMAEKRDLGGGLSGLLE
jgi:hypothetical protein